MAVAHLLGREMEEKIFLFYSKEIYSASQSEREQDPIC